MTTGEFYEKLTIILLLCDGWMTSGTRSIRHNAEVWGVWDSLHQVALAIDCQLEAKDAKLGTFHHHLSVPPGHVDADKTLGDLFIRLCDRVGLLAIDEGDHYHVQLKWP